jgi:hypothetical protein
LVRRLEKPVDLRAFARTVHPGLILAGIAEFLMRPNISEIGVLQERIPQQPMVLAASKDLTPKMTGQRQVRG